MSTWESLCRMFAYTRPYKGRLAIGVIAAILTGGSLVGVLHYSRAAVQPFESRTAPEAALATPDAPPQGSEASLPDSFREFAKKHDIPLSKPNGEMTWQFVLLSMVGLVGFFLAKSLAGYVNRYYMSWVGARAVVDMRNELFESLQEQSLSFHKDSEVGLLVSKSMTDVAVMERSIGAIVEGCIQAPFEIFFAVGYVLWYSSKHDIMALPVALFIVLPLCVVPLIVIGRRVRKFTKTSLSGVANLTSRMIENLSGIQVVKAFHTEESELQRFQTTNRNYFRQVMKAMRAQLLMTPMMQTVACACACLFIVYCFTMNVRLSQIVPMGAAAFFCYQPMKKLSKLNVYLQRMNAAAGRVFSLMDTDTALPVSPNPVSVDRLEGGIRFENVSFQYTDEAGPVLQDINLEIAKGKVVAFAGETGSGKSTLASLMVRFYDPTSGQIVINAREAGADAEQGGTDHDLRELEIGSLRSLIGVVTQKTILFNDSIRFNIRYGSPEATDEQVEEAAKLAFAHEFIMEKPGDYDFQVGDKGAKLSGGQGQRIAIARAILRNPQILILDEATSALDTVTEQQVQSALNNLMKDRTVFAIAHRMSTIRSADCIHVLDAGRIVESGTHDELMALEGAYARLMREA